MLGIDVSLQRGHFTLDAKVIFDSYVTGLFGPSGSGKSTLLSVIAGLADPERGYIKLDGEVLFDSCKRIRLPPDRRRIGMVFQDSQLFPHLSVEGNLLYGLKRTPKQDRRFQFKEIVDLLEIGHLLHSHPRRLSGGEKQRVALGRSLLASPRLLLLDEPLASLDQGLKEQILPFLERVKNELRLPMIYVSHALHEILHLTDRLVVIAHGRIRGAGPLHEIIKDQEVLQLAGRLGLQNVLPVILLAHDVPSGCSLAIFNGNRLVLPLSQRLEVGQTCYISVRPGEIALARRPVVGISIQNQIKGRIEGLSMHPHCVMVQVDVGSRLLVEITARSLQDLGLKEGDLVYCLIKAQSFSYMNTQDWAVSSPSASTYGFVVTDAAVANLPQEGSQRQGRLDER